MGFLPILLIRPLDAPLQHAVNMHEKNVLTDGIPSHTSKKTARSLAGVHWNERSD